MRLGLKFVDVDDNSRIKILIMEDKVSVDIEAVLEENFELWRRFQLECCDRGYKGYKFLKQFILKQFNENYFKLFN